MTFNSTSMDITITHHKQYVSAVIKYRGLEIPLRDKTVRKLRKRLKIHKYQLAFCMSHIDDIFNLQSRHKAVDDKGFLTIKAFYNEALKANVSIALITNLIQLVSSDTDIVYAYPLPIDFHTRFMLFTPRACGKTNLSNRMHRVVISGDHLASLHKQYSAQALLVNNRKPENVFTLERWLKKYRCHDKDPVTNAFITRYLETPSVLSKLANDNSSNRDSGGIPDGARKE
jgi:hypothetical protein